MKASVEGLRHVNQLYWALKENKQTDIDFRTKVVHSQPLCESHISQFCHPYKFDGNVLLLSEILSTTKMSCYTRKFVHAANLLL